MRFQTDSTIHLALSREQMSARWLVVGALFMASLNLRPSVASIAPVLGSIQQDLGISGAVSSLLVSIPVLCMGLLAPFSVRLSERLGNEQVIAWSLVLIGGSTLLRVVIHSATLLFLTALLSGIGIAMMGPLLSGFIKKHLAGSVPSMIALYSMALSLGAALGSGLTSPFQWKFHSWQTALALWSILALLALPLWYKVLRQQSHDSAKEVTRSRPLKLPWKTKKAWLISIHFGLLVMVFYSLLGWFPLMLITAGVSRLHAGMMMTLFTVIQIPSGMILQVLLRVLPSRRTWLILSSSILAIGFMLLFLPIMSWLAVLLCGFGSGLLFAIANLLPVEAASTPEEAASWAAMTQSLGFLIGAGGPTLMGWIYDRMGTFTLGIICMISISMMMGIISLFIVPRKDLFLASW